MASSFEKLSKRGKSFMTEISELRSWIKYAEEDYKAAKTLLGLRKPLLSAV
jgi:hypothetical protein